MSNITETEIVTESPKTPRNFRTAIDIENFYRFVHENGLRREAGMMLEYAIDRLRKARKNKRAAKTLQ